MGDREFLVWLQDRLINVYHESPHLDFVQRLGNIVDRTPKSAELVPSSNIASRAILKEADVLRKEHQSKDVRFFAESVYRELSKQQA